MAVSPVAPKGNRVTARRDTPAFRMFPSPLAWNVRFAVKWHDEDKELIPWGWSPNWQAW